MRSVRERAKKRREEKKFYKKHALPDVEEEIDYEKGEEEAKHEPEQIRPFGLFKYANDNEVYNFRSLDYYNHYKRTGRNIKETLAGLLNYSKQGMPCTIYPGQVIKISEVRLNKACSVVHVWWSLSFIEVEEKAEEMLADIQRRLTRARGYFAGHVASALGLRYAPDIRFYIDKADEEHEEFMRGLSERLSSKKHDEELYKEIQVLKSWSPSQIAQLKSTIKDEETKEKLERLLSREEMERSQKEAEEAAKHMRRMKEEIDSKAPKIKKVKQARLEAMKKKQEDIYRACGYDPQKIMNPKEEDLQDIGDEFLYSYKREIPNKSRKKLDSEGKRIRKHPRDENGKKIKTKKTLSKAEKFWNKLS